MLALYKFQSALPRGERPGAYRTGVLIMGISIRAPARGATYALRTGSGRNIYSNPRSREGGDILKG